MGVTLTGKVSNKSHWLSEIKKDKDSYKSATNGKIDVRVYGGQTAVVTGAATEVGTDKDGKEFRRTFRWIDTWVDRNGKWQIVASQAMPVLK